MTIPNTRLDELAAMEQAATARPWVCCEGRVKCEALVVASCWDQSDSTAAFGKPQENRDARFIAASRNEFAAMIEQCKEANRLREAMLATYKSPTVSGIFSIIEAALKGATP